MPREGTDVQSAIDEVIDQRDSLMPQLKAVLNLD